MLPCEDATAPVSVTSTNTHTHTHTRTHCGPGTGENQAYVGGMTLPCPLATLYSRQQSTGVCRMREGTNPAVISKQQRAALAILRGRRILFYISVMNI